MVFQKKIKRVRKIDLVVIGFILTICVSGCSDISIEETQDIEKVSEEKIDVEKGCGDEEKIIGICQDIYTQAAEENRLADLEVIRNIVNQLGKNGYPAIDSENQINMVESEKVVLFCEMVDTKDEAEMTIAEVGYLGFAKYDMKTEHGNVNVVKSYYKYENGNIQKIFTGSYKAEYWDYSENGYLMFSGVLFSEELYVLTLSGTEEHVAFRIEPLEEIYRELNRKYLRPIGYEKNNMFLVDWSEDEFGDLNFYDIYDILYPKVNLKYVPYIMDHNLGIGSIYRIPKDEFEHVIMKYFKIDSETLQTKTNYCLDDLTYEYKPRGFYEVEYPEYPYSEVVDFTEN